MCLFACEKFIWEDMNIKWDLYSWETVDCESDVFYCQSSLHKKILQDDDEVSAANGSVGGHSTSLLSTGTNLHLS